jgi:uncharacterized sulfatase
MMSPRPDIVFIVLDTHRVDRLGCFGYDRDTSPNLDDYAKNSTTYMKAISPAQWTIPSHASMFSGEYPITHKTIQANDALSDLWITMAEYLQQVGYHTVGFCNNPLVGVLDNGFRRGFNEFYNYGGTIPSKPSTNGDNPHSLLTLIRDHYFKLIDRIATPIQQAVAASPDVFKIALNPLLVPLWSRYSNFKGDTAASIQDTTRFLKTPNIQPRFVFLNLMETHLPYTPPRRFVQRFAPAVLNDPDVGEFMRFYNTQALHWLLPLEKPYPKTQAEVLSNMYDAEVAYQDHLLNQLLTVLEQPEHLDNTLVIIVGDHGEMLGEHQIMGHGLGVHEELVHVPLIIRFPGQVISRRITEPVSTVHLFHTVLDAIGIEAINAPNGELNFAAEKSLMRTSINSELIFSEAYPPDNLIIIMEKYAPSLIDRFHCRSPRWAVYNQPYKLIRIENIRDEVYNYKNDPGETKVLKPKGKTGSKLSMGLNDFLQSALQNVGDHPRGSATNLDNQKVLERLRNLGYIE